MAFISSSRLISCAAVLLLVHSSYHYGYNPLKADRRSLVSYTHNGDMTTIWYNSSYSVTFNSSQYASKYDDDAYENYYENATIYYDDDQAVDDQVEDDQQLEQDNEIYYYEPSDDPWADDNSFIGRIVQISMQFQESFQNVFQKDPRQWTGQEWGFLGGSIGVILTLIGLMACCCHCSARKCTNVCEKPRDDFTISSNASLISNDDDGTRHSLPTTVMSNTMEGKGDNDMSYVRMAPSGMKGMDRV